MLKCFAFYVILETSFTSILKNEVHSSYNKKVIVKDIEGAIHDGERYKIAGEH